MEHEGVEACALRRTFHICFDGNEDHVGTGVAFEVDGREYLVTARHVMTPEPRELLIEKDDGWHPFQIAHLVKGDSDRSDVVILSLKSPLAPSAGLNPLPPASSTAFVLGQSVYALGFPNGQGIKAGRMNMGLPIPFVRRGCIAGWDAPTDPDRRIYIDGHVNHGMSGGPVIVASDSWRHPLLIGIILSFVSLHSPIRQGPGSDARPTSSEDDPPLFSVGNEGLYEVLDISAVTLLAQRHGSGRLIT